MRCGCRLDCRGNGADMKPKTKIGVISKKKKIKKKGHRLLVPRFVSFSSPKVEKFFNRAGVDLFFFFGDHPKFRLCFRICALASTIKPATASHRPAFVGVLIEMSINLVKSVVFHRSRKRDLRSKKRDKASKSGTYGNPTNRPQFGIHFSYLVSCKNLVSAASRFGILG